MKIGYLFALRFRSGYLQPIESLFDQRVIRWFAKPVVNWTHCSFVGR